MENITTDSTFSVPAFSKVTAIEYIKTLNVLVTHRSPKDVDFFLKNEEAFCITYEMFVLHCLGIFGTRKDFFLRRLVL